MLRKVGLCQRFVGEIEFLTGKKYEKFAQIECDLNFVRIGWGKVGGTHRDLRAEEAGLALREDAAGSLRAA